MVKVSAAVETKLKEELPSRFGLIFDGWSDVDTHYVAVFAVYMSSGSVARPLLAFAPLLDETNLGAESHFEFLSATLELYGRSMQSVLFFVGDNCSTNKALANLADVPLVGCASHRLNLACKQIFDCHSAMLQKMSSLMSRLSTLKNAARLRDVTELHPVTRNVTRWTSTFEMIQRYKELKPFLPSLLLKDSVLLDYVLTPREDHTLETLETPLLAMLDVTLSLQKEGLLLSDARAFFDALMADYKDYNLGKYLGKDAQIIHSPTFESGLIKISDGNEKDMTVQEKIALEDFLLENDDDTVQEMEDNENVSYSQQVLSKKRKVVRPTLYCDVSYIPPTSNCVERLFSHAKQILRCHRKRLLPRNVEALIFLKQNRSYWDLETVQDAMK
jgi:hypothetical protein